MSYKDGFYEKYFSTHIVQRKGYPTVEQFRSRSFYFDKHWHRLFPKDKGARIVDVGCGSGSLVWWLQDVGFVNAEGIDVSPEQVKAAQELGIKNIQTADLRLFLAARPDHYDVVVLKDVLEHFSKQEIIHVLESCHNSLKLGGRIIFQVPNAETPFFGGVRYGDFTHEMAFTVSSLQQLLSVIGFVNARFYSAEPAITGGKSLALFVAWKAVEALYRFLIYVETRRERSIVTENIIVVAIKA